MREEGTLRVLKVYSKIGSNVLTVYSIPEGLKARWVHLIDRHDGKQLLRELTALRVDGKIRITEAVVEKGERKEELPREYKIERCPDSFLDIFIREITSPERSLGFDMDTLLRVRDTLSKPFVACR